MVLFVKLFYIVKYNKFPEKNEEIFIGKLRKWKIYFTLDITRNL